MSKLIICCGGYQRVLAIFFGLVMTFTWPASGQTIYPIEPPQQKTDLPWLSKVGRGQYVPLRLKRLDEKHVEKFETSFEECAPGRNSGANEWSAFGAIGNMDFNAMGRELWVRYPAFELEFRLQDGNAVIEPGQLESFRLGLVNNRLARHLGRLAARRAALQGFGDDGSQSAMRKLRFVQAGSPEPHGQAAAEQTVRRGGRTAGHAR